ncbi:MAG: HAMP domain-containing protein, partial [Myxococcota bacterium]|nr:HAMP domain-containing protein [Myxococcota bacterium]
MLLIVSLGPLLTAGFVNVNRAMDRGKKNAANHFADTTRLTANAFSDLFEHLQFELRSIARRFPAEDFDADSIRRQLAVQPGLLPSLDQWQDAPFVSFAGRDFRTFFLALPDGEVYYAYPYRNVTRPVKLGAHDWFQQGRLKGGMMAGPMPALTGTRGPSLVVTMPLFNSAKKPVGYIGALVDTRRLQQVIGRAERDRASENKGAFMLRTPSGLIMAHTDSKQVGRTAQADVLRTATSETTELTRGERTLLVANWAVGKNGWVVTRTASTDYVYRFVHELIRVLIVVTVLTFLFILLLADYLAGLILRPIRELERGAQMIGAGALDYRIELDAHRADELGQLARSFNSMADSLQDTQSQIRAYGRSLETANQELDAMVYAITHDVRKSLRGIGAYTRFLDDDFGQQLGNNGREMLNTISINVDR